MISCANWFCLILFIFYKTSTTLIIWYILTLFIHTTITSSIDFKTFAIFIFCSCILYAITSAWKKLFIIYTILNGFPRFSLGCISDWRIICCCCCWYDVVVGVVVVVYVAFFIVIKVLLISDFALVNRRQQWWNWYRCFHCLSSIASANCENICNGLQAYSIFPG